MYSRKSALLARREYILDSAEIALLALFDIGKNAVSLLFFAQFSVYLVKRLARFLVTFALTLRKTFHTRKTILRGIFFLSVFCGVAPNLFKFGFVFVYLALALGQIVKKTLFLTLDFLRAPFRH